jgi:hypothetical protein
MDVVEFLLPFGGDRTAGNNQGQTPAEAARERGFEETTAALDSSA